MKSTLTYILLKKYYEEVFSTGTSPTTIQFEDRSVTHETKCGTQNHVIDVPEAYLPGTCDCSAILSIYAGNYDACD